MTIVGIDPSIVGTGIYTKDHQGVIRALPGFEEARLICLTNAVGDWIEDNAPDPDIVMEGPFVNVKHFRGQQLLVAYHWMLRCSFFEMGWPVRIVMPPTLKKFALGKGSGPGTDKAAMVAAAKAAGFDTDDHNLADAFWLWKIGYADRIMDMDDIANYQPKETK